MMPDLIGLVGFARTGKNSFADFLIENINKDSAPTCTFKPISFAYALRQELDNFLIDKLGVSALLKTLKKKKLFGLY